MSTPAPMICPKCRGQMSSYERSGITVDQCADCRGIFLDRGELERLIDAESAYLQRTQPEQSSSRRDNDEQYRRKDEGYRYEGYDRDDKRHHRRGGFLSDLFD